MLTKENLIKNDPTEAQTRARYIDTMLLDAGWV